MHPKKRHISLVTWGVLFTSLLAAIVMQISCSHEPNRMAGSTVDPQVTELIDMQSAMPPVADATSTPTAMPPIIKGIVKDITGGIKDITGDVHDLLIPPCGEDSARVSRLLGGTITLHCGGEVVGEFRVNPLAIPRDTVIHVQSYSLQILGIALREYHFSPEGLKFKTSATMKLSSTLFADSKGVLPTEILWLYLNPLTEKWDLQNVISVASDGNFYVPVNHFSVYRAATKSGIGISQGGQANQQNMK